MRDTLTILCVLALCLGIVVPARAQASNDALLRLLQVLRDRGSITAQEYDEIRLVASGPPAPAAPIPAPAATPASQAPAPLAAADVPQLVNKALANKWYEKIG